MNDSNTQSVEAINSITFLWCFNKYSS